MSSINQLIPKIEMDSARERIGLEPIHIIAKVQPDDHQDQQIDFSDRASSIHELPKFASSKQSKIIGLKNNRFQESRNIFSRILEKRNKETSQPKCKKQIGKTAIMMKMIIWMCYALGTSLVDQPSISLLTGVDFVGTGLAIFYSLYGIIFDNNRLQLDHLLHFINLISTVALFTYSPSEGDHFMGYLRAMRSLRLLFIVNINFSFQDLWAIYSHKTMKIIRLLLPWILFMFIFTISMFQSTSGNFYNRCSTIVDFAAIPNNKTDILCGRTQCPNGLVCANPFSFDQIPKGSDYYATKNLGFGYFQYDNFLHSWFTIASTAFLSNSALIIDMFSNSAPAGLVSIFNLSLILSSLFVLSPIILVLVQEKFQEFKQEDRSPVQLSESNVSPIDLNSFAAPTFGPASLKSIQKHFHIKTASDAHLNLKTQRGKQTTRTVKFAQKDSELESVEQKKQQVNCLSKLFQYITIIFIITVGSLHFALAATFSFFDLEQIQRRLVGVCLCVVFIVWSFWIAIKSSGVTDQSEESKKQKGTSENNKIIFSIELFIYCIHLFDYIARILIGNTFLEGSSPITPLATSVLIIRIMYLPLAFEEITFKSDLWKRLNNQLKIFVEICCSNMGYLRFVVSFSIILGSITREVSKLNFFSEILKYIKISTNLNWLNHITSETRGNIVNDADGWGVALNFLLILLFELIIIKLIYSDGMMIAYAAITKAKNLFTVNSYDQDISADDINTARHQQATFFLISFSATGLRGRLQALLDSKKYKSARSSIISFYFVGIIFCYIFLNESQMLGFVLLVFDCLFLLDFALEIFAYRFWGLGSFADYRMYRIANLVVSLLIIINAITIKQDVFILRILRAFLLIEIYQELKNSYNNLKIYFRVLSKMLLFFIILWVFICLFTCIAYKDDNKSAAIKISRNLIHSLRFLNKNFDLQLAVSSDQSSDLGSLYNFVLYFFMSLPLECLLAGVAFTQLQHLKKQTEERKIKANSIKINGNQNNFVSAAEQFQISQIKEKILQLEPSFNPLANHKPNFFTNLIKQSIHVYSFIGLAIAMTDLLLTITIPIVNKYIAAEQLMCMKFVKVFLCFLGISIFTFQSIIYKGNNSHFYLKLFLNIFSFPGTFLILVNMPKVQASESLINVLYFFLVLSPIPLFQLYFVAQNKIARIVRYTYNKFSKTLWTLAWIFIFTCFFSGLTSLLNQKQFLLNFSLIFIGIFGANYQNKLEEGINSQLSVLHFVEIIIFLLGFCLRPLLLANFVFQASHKTGFYQQERREKMEVMRQIYSETFQQDIFLNLWNKLDTKSTGMISYKTVLNNIYSFTKCFNLHSHSIHYLLSRRHQTFALKLQLFRDLHFPIKIANIMETNSNNKQNQYIITMYDLVSTLFCYSLTQKSHEQNERQKQSFSQQEMMKIWFHRFGLQNQDWNIKVSNKISGLNTKKQDDGQQLEQKYYVSKNADTDSWSLGSIIQIFPSLRKKISLIRAKID